MHACKWIGLDRCSAVATQTAFLSLVVAVVLCGNDDTNDTDDTDDDDGGTPV